MVGVLPGTSRSSHANDLVRKRKIVLAVLPVAGRIGVVSEEPRTPGDEMTTTNLACAIKGECLRMGVPVKYRAWIDCTLFDYQCQQQDEAKRESMSAFYDWLACEVNELEFDDTSEWEDPRAVILMVLDGCKING